MTEEVKNKIAERVTALIPKAGSVSQFADNILARGLKIYKIVDGKAIDIKEVKE